MSSTLDSGADDFRCETCGKDFDSLQDLQIHKEATHTSIDEISGGGTAGTDTGVARGTGGDILPEQSQDSLSEG